MTDAPDARTARQRMLDGDLYRADDPELEAMALRARRLQDRYNRSDADDEAARQAILAELVASIGTGCVVRPPFFCDYGSHLVLGDRVFANFGLVALDVAPIAIGDDVQIATNVQLLTPTHPIAPAPRRAGWEAARPITIRDNVWLGGGVIVLGGVTIGENTVVGAGSVVTNDLPRDVVAVGSPARPVKSVHDGPGVPPPGPGAR